MTRIATTPEIDRLLADNSPVAIGVSGGKDSSAVAMATIEYLNQISHAGPRLLIHSDLGMVEWKDSRASCERLSDSLGVELSIVSRVKGGMMERWEQRWYDNVERYANLECVKLILPWSTPDMRFCTSELKVAPICRELVRRFPGQTIINVTGIRRQESDGRKNAPIAKVQPKLASKVRVGKEWRVSTTGIDWHPIVEWSADDVFTLLADRGIALHEAYTRYGLSRVSCAFCIMQSERDRLAAAACVDNHPLFRRMTTLESASTFAFQGDKWLADTAPHLLTAAQRGASLRARENAQARVQAESWLPKHLLYVKGWPTCVPTTAEAESLAAMRIDVAGAVGLEVDYTAADAVIERYRELFQAQHGMVAA